MLIRRFLAVILGIVFIPVAIVALLFLRLNDTFLEDDFYVSQLRQADIFNFLYDDIAPLAIEEVRAETTDLVIDIGEVSPELVAAVREAFPPEWLDEQVEGAVRAFLPYLVGDTEEFLISVPVADRVRAAGAALKKALSNDKLVELLYQDVVAVQIQEALEQQGAVPFGLDVTQDQIEAVVRGIAPPEWLRAQIEGAVDALLPYLAGDTDQFTITISVSDRAEAAGEELKGLLALWDARDFLFEQVIDPVIQQSIGDDFLLPFNLLLSSQDVKQVIRDVVTEEWLDPRTEELIDVTVGFLVGEGESFAYVVPLVERKEVAVASVGRLMDQRLTQLYASTRPCTLEELAALDPRQFADQGIPCRPPEMTLDDLKALVGLSDYQGRVAQVVGDAVPDSLTFTEADLRRALGPEQSQRLDEIRLWVQRGFAFTDADLEEVLVMADYEGAIPWEALDDAAQRRAVAESENVEVLEDVRREVRQGLTFTQEDLRERLAEDDDSYALSDFDQGRTWLGRARSFSIAAWLMPAAILLSVGILGGRRLSAKIAWAAFFLTIPAGIVFAAAGPVYDRVAAPEIQDLFDEKLLDPDADRTALEETGLRKGSSVVLNVGDDFSSGLAQRALLLLIVGGGAFGVALLWQRVIRTRGPPASPPK